MARPAKPQGTTGPVKLGPHGAEWAVIALPPDNAERERLIARLFIEGFSRWVAMESEPSLAPFGSLQQNEEDNLDFTVVTAQGEKLMELVEFAPLKEHGPRFSDAPPALEPREKAALAVHRVNEKSAHQGGAERFLVIYSTEHAFWLDPVTIERMRRIFSSAPPRFERVYYVSLHELNRASATEIYPGKPHHIIGDMTDEELDRGRVMLPHPTEFSVVRTSEVTVVLGVNRSPISTRVKYEVTGLETVKRRSTPK